MIYRIVLVSLTLAAAPAAAGDSDFITREAGNAVSQNIVVQSEWMWPPGSYGRSTKVPADYAIRKLLAAEQAGSDVTSQSAQGSTGGASGSTSSSGSE